MEPNEVMKEDKPFRFSISPVPRLYRFRPEPDITAYELAMLLKILSGANHEITIGLNAKTSEALGPEAMRHLKEI